MNLALKNDYIFTEINNPDFKVIIFDLNGTITPSVSKDPRHIAFRDQYIQNQLNGIKPDMLPDSTTQALQLCNLEVETYYHYRNKLIDWNLFHSFNHGTYEIIKAFKEQGYLLVLYTDCYENQINATLEILKMQKLFNLVISREMGYKKPSVKAYKFVARKFGLSCKELLMVANDWDMDLKPLQLLGGSTIWIESENQLKNVQEVINTCHIWQKFQQP